jgi:hypothetical protein
LTRASGGRVPSRASTPASDTYTLGTAKRIGHIVGALGEPDDPLGAEAVDVERVAELQAPGVGQSPLDHDLAWPGRNVAPGDDRVAATAGLDHLDRAVVGEVVRALEPHPGHFLAHGVGRHIRERGDPLTHAVGGLRIEAHDHVR